MPGTARRASPLPAEERRAAILDATIPLLREHGMRVTTRQIATAAGVAEGTLFRVFPDKKSLVDAAVRSALAPEPLHAALTHVDTTLPLHERLLVIVGLLQRRLSGIIELMTAVGVHRPPGGPPAGTGVGSGPSTGPPRDAAHGEFLELVAALLEPDRAALTLPPHQVARMLRLLTFAGTHPVISGGDPLTAEEIVAVVLNGVRRRDDPNQAPARAKPSPRNRNPSSTRSNGKEA